MGFLGLVSTLGFFYFGWRAFTNIPPMAGEMVYHVWFTIFGTILVGLDVLGILSGALRLGPLVVGFNVIGVLVANAIGAPWFYGIFAASRVWSILNIGVDLSRIFSPHRYIRDSRLYDFRGD